MNWQQIGAGGALGLLLSCKPVPAPGAPTTEIDGPSPRADASGTGDGRGLPNAQGVDGGALEAAALPDQPAARDAEDARDSPAEQAALAFVSYLAVVTDRADRLRPGAYRAGFDPRRLDHAAIPRVMRSISSAGVEFLDPNQDQKDRKISKNAIRSSLKRRQGQAFETLAHIGYLRSHVSIVAPQDRAVSFVRSKEGSDTVLLDLGGRYELRFRVQGATVVLYQSKYNVIEDGP